MTTIDKYKIYLSPSIDQEFPIQFLSIDELNSLKDKYEIKESDYITELIPNDGFFQIFDKNKYDLNQLDLLSEDLIDTFLQETDNKNKIVLLSKIHDILADKYYLNELKNEITKYDNLYGTNIHSQYYLNLVQTILQPPPKKEQQPIQPASEKDKILLFSQGNKASRLSSITEYILQNRKAFAIFIRQKFQAEVNNLPFTPTRMWDSTLNQFVEKIPFEQQKFVSYYLSEYTPYRGLLLYHGLGSGKTGSSIMIAEGFRNRRVVVLLPASLHTNYENEIKTFGEIAYKKQFNWKFVKIEINSETGKPFNYAYETLHSKGIHPELLDNILIKYKDNYGIFMINYSANKPNYDDLSLTDRTRIDSQIKKMLEWKYSILHYNAGSYTIPSILQKCLTTSQYNKILKDLFNTETKSTFSIGSVSKMLDYVFNPQNNVPNPFDDKVVIIDEVHNITSHLIGNGYVALFIYELIMRAKNCKLVFLSGTPLINSSFELALLFNMLNGFIYEYTMPLTKKGGIITADELTQIMNNSKYVDRYTIDSLKGIIKFTLVPREFENSYVSGKYIGVKKSIDDAKNEDMINDIIRLLNNKGYEVNESFIKETLYTLFPDILNHETSVAIANKRAKPNKSTTKKELNYLMGSNKRLRLINDEQFRNEYDIKNDAKDFKSKIQGFISFYNEIAGTDQTTGYNLFPTKIDATADETNVIMSDYQYIEYCQRAFYEFQKEENAKLQKLIMREKAIKGDIVDFGEIPTTFRVYSRQAGIFVFPPNIERPTRLLSRKLAKLSYDDIYKMVKSLISINNIEERYHRLSRMMSRLKFTSIQTEYNNDVTLLSVLRDIYPNYIQPGDKLDLFKDTINRDAPLLREDIKISENNIANEVNDEHNDDIITDSTDETGNVIKDDICTDEYGECSSQEKEADIDYEKAIIQAMNKLQPANLMLSSSQEDKGASVNYLTLEMLSPKYAKILENINNTPGLVMCYSQYRSVEGIELLSRVLQSNGYIPYTNQPESIIINIGMRVRYEYEKDKWRTGIVTNKAKLKNTSQIVYRIDDNQKYNSRSQIHPCQYSLWTGTETVEQRRVILDAFNNINNRFGQKCLVIMITQAGAEGISLFNVRQVHILEPYWNNVRIRQVVGRARRIRSHINLPPDQQNVKVFNYIIKFAVNQQQYNTSIPAQVDPTKWLKNLIELVGFDNIKPLLFRLYKINEYSDSALTDINEKSQEAAKADQFNTADQMLESASLIKDEIINYFGKMMKESAVDCDFNKNENIKSDPSLANMNCYQDITDIQSKPFIYNYTDTYTQISNLPESTKVNLESKPQLLPINIDFPFRNPVDKKTTVRLAVKTEIPSDKPIPSSFTDKLIYIKPNMRVYKFDTSTKSIIDEDIFVGNTIEITKDDGSKVIGVKFGQNYIDSLK